MKKYEAFEDKKENIKASESEKIAKKNASKRGAIKKEESLFFFNWR